MEDLRAIRTRREPSTPLIGAPGGFSGPLLNLIPVFESKSLRSPYLRREVIVVRASG
jgi:hypothetical protein